MQDPVLSPLVYEAKGICALWSTLVGLPSVVVCGPPCAGMVTLRSGSV